MRLVSIFPFIAVLSFSSTAFAQQLEAMAREVSGESFVRAFLGNCAQNVGNIDRVISASEALRYLPLPQELEPVMAPQDPNAEFVGYIVLEGDGAPYMLGVSSGIVQGGVLETCAVANPYIEVDGVLAALTSFANLSEPDIDETSMGQRYRVWHTNEWAQGSFVSMTDAEPMGWEGVTLSILSPSQN